MSFKTIKQIIELDTNFDLHAARILILLSSLENHTKKEIKGITKLVKLDFLLRYPTVLELALEKKTTSHQSLVIHPHEKTSVESKMVRFRYGPWDHRYYQYLAMLESMGLVTVQTVDNAVETRITNKGIEVANQFKSQESMKDFIIRSNLISEKFGKINATKLKDMMYELIPELHDMKFGEVIEP